MKNFNKTAFITSIASIVSVLILGVFTLFMYTKPEPVFIDLNRLFSGFKMSIEKQEELTNVGNDFQMKLDSLNMIIESVEKSISKEYSEGLIKELDQRKAYYKDTEASMVNYLEELKAKTDEEIWVQLNGYVKSFGDENNYSLILGGNGSGAIMYVDDKLDVTEQAIEFVNREYDGL